MHRLPRFSRAEVVAPIHITSRDVEIIRLVARHRFLRSSQVLALIGGSSGQILRRLQLLYHHGYLERPRTQIDYYHKGGSRRIAYGVGTKGAEMLKGEHIIASRGLRWGDKNSSIGRVFLDHALFVSEVMVNLELACRQRGIRLLTGEELHAKPFRWHVNANGRKLGVIPDRVFALEYASETGNSERAFFFLEADRGTMPVIRSDLLQTSFYRKLLAYEATWSQSIHRERFGFHRLRVITVTQSAARLKSLLDACSTMERGHGLFLFADKGALEYPSAILSQIWQSGTGERTTLLD